MKYALFPLLLMCLTLTTGCIYDDVDNCDVTLQLRFSYTGDGDTEIFNRKIHQLELYVFNEEHGVEFFRPLTPGEIASRSIELKLPVGQTYHAVCIGMEGTDPHNTAVSNVDGGNLGDMKFHHQGADNPGITEVSQDHLYHADQLLNLTRAGNVTGTMKLSAAHIDMYVEVAGYEEIFLASAPTRADGDPVLSIEHEGVPKWVDFLGGGHSTETTSHFPHTVAAQDEEDLHVHEYQVLRNLHGSMIHVKNAAGETVYSLDVSEFLEEHPDIDPELQEALVPIRIEFKSVDLVEVTIPAWAIEPVDPQF